MPDVVLKKATCSLVIEQDGKLLLVQEADPDIYQLWNQPAGHVEPDETFEQCALREAREETGYDVDLIGLQAIYYDVAAGDVEINICFRARPLGEPRHPLADDVLGTRWFSRAELMAFPREQLRHARTLRRLEDWLAGKAFPLEVIVQSPLRFG
ncbi:MAG TPA: NUDIX domain-containing protein [Ktedonobacterales bacterium]|jgi:ADP-ribose pyrophosphatase YjhB (NUDIX family)